MDRRSTMTGDPPIPSPSQCAPGVSASGHSSKKKKRDRKSETTDILSCTDQFLQLVAILVVAGIVAAVGFKTAEWLQKQFKPFCESGSDNSGDCIPCPQKGVCVQNRLQCFPGFRRVGNRCLQDKEIDQIAQKLANLVRDHVCGVAARSACEGATKGVWLAESDIMSELTTYQLQRQLGLDAAKLLLSYEKAFLLARDILAIQENLQGEWEFHCPGSLMETFKPINCQLQQWVMANSLGIFLVSPIVFVVIAALYRWLSRKRSYAAASQLYLRVCEALEDKAMGASSGKESWVVVAHLRDHLLSPREKNRGPLWKEVERMALADSRIDQYQRKVKGETKIVWEWQVEGALIKSASHSNTGQKIAFASLN